MDSKNYTVKFTVNATPSQAFKSINNVQEWWTQNLEGNSQKPDGSFTVRFSNVHMSKQKVVEFIPGKKVVWLVTDSGLNFISDKEEWTGTQISFEIFKKDGKTEIIFTHIGLVAEVECYTSCTKGWDYYIKGSLFKLLTEGKGSPELKKLS